MNQQQITFSQNGDNSFTIAVKKSPLIIRIILILVLLIFFLSPVLVLGFMAIEREELKFGIFISFALFWGIAYYLFRVITWNTYGKEIFTIENDKVKYYSDFKYFKDSFKEIENKDLTIEFEPIGYQEDNQGVLFIKSQSDALTSVIKVEIPELKQTISKIEGIVKD